jgi:hypothetical protein
LAVITKKIGLSLGADICWPICFEQVIRDLDLRVESGEDEIRVEVERLTIEPFDLSQPCRYDVVIDRLTHWYHLSREWIKKAVLMDGLYVFNNPWSLQSMEKHTSYCAMMRLGLPVPDTWMVPPKEYEPVSDLEPTLERYAKMFDLGEVGDSLGFPMFMKPYDGGAWVGVSKIDSDGQLRAAYEQSGSRVMHLQQAVDPHDLFVRCLGVGPQVNMISYDPSAPLHERYQVEFEIVDADDWSLLEDMALTINGFFGWDFNSCEALRQDGVFFPIDFANACPDSQVTSLHFHFPWLIKAKVRWALFCAVTDRTMPLNLDWESYFEIADRDLPYRERLRQYAALSRKRFQSEEFADFCTKYLGDLDEVVWNFFGSDQAKDAIRLKVEALFPKHEVDHFTEHFWGLVQFWRKTEADRLDTSETSAGA